MQINYNIHTSLIVYYQLVVTANIYRHENLSINSSFELFADLFN